MMVSWYEQNRQPLADGDEIVWWLMRESLRGFVTHTQAHGYESHWFVSDDKPMIISGHRDLDEAKKFIEHKLAGAQV